MKQYLITETPEEKILLENVDERNKQSVLFTQEEFGIFMIYPPLNKSEVFERLWEIADKSQGKVVVHNMVDQAFVILGR